MYGKRLTAQCFRLVELAFCAVKACLVQKDGRQVKGSEALLANLQRGAVGRFGLGVMSICLQLLPRGDEFAPGVFGQFGREGDGCDEQERKRDGLHEQFQLNYQYVTDQLTQQ